jgi:hypothetical protein
MRLFSGPLDKAVTEGYLRGAAVTTVIAAPPHHQGDTDMECSFVVGDLVAMKPGLRPITNRYEDMAPLSGMVYTVSEVLLSANHPQEPHPNQPALRFVEIVNPPHQYVCGVMECYFAAFAFQKVPTPSIEVFKEMLAPTPVLEDA